MMLFGELKNGGALLINVKDGALVLTSKVKAPKVVDEAPSDNII
jgi:hypothetical protein